MDIKKLKELHYKIFNRHLQHCDSMDVDQIFYSSNKDINDRLDHIESALRKNKIDEYISTNDDILKVFDESCEDEFSIDGIISNSNEFTI